ncbi:MAG: DUF3472 domain-containing protein [Bacteroidota bacterium]|nr:DUF3472 domain-containing protein [Bacteroidota bacterium]
MRKIKNYLLQFKAKQTKNVSQLITFTKYSVALAIFMSCSNVTPSVEIPDPVYKFEVSIPTQGNSWVTNNLSQNSTVITENGIEKWNNSSSVIATFFKTTSTGKMQIGLRAKSTTGQSKLKVRYGNKEVVVEIKSNTLNDVYVATFDVVSAGYQKIEMQGVEKSDAYFAEITDLLVGGEVSKQKIYWVKEDFYWGRRGPSVHLNYEIPQNSGDIKWFYNEVSIPKGEDVLGSYFMANGFKEGYFGIQVNSDTERRILFSVWSPYTTDNPSSIPNDYKIKLLKKGSAVYSGEFGNEGSGGQSYLVYNWKPAIKYRFLLKVEPVGDNSTDYTAYFFDPEKSNWELIASFRRPYTNTYLKSPYSFLENFMTETGQLARKGNYLNQWVCNTNGTWFEMVRARFTADATARKESRMDYSGGTENGVFYLKNCGFFSETTPLDTYFNRPATGITPAIDFSKLP